MHNRLPPYQSFADPASFHAQTSGSKAEEEAATAAAAAESSNGKQIAKKSN